MKTIFITGASSGLGEATARLFAENNWNVVASMRYPEKKSELAKIANIRVVKLDVANIESIHNAVNNTLKTHSVDVLFNNAGYGLMGPFEGYTDEQIVRQFNTNVLGVIRLTQAFLPHFRKKKSGLIVNTTSIGGLTTFPFSSIYQATKWAIEGWSESISYELATQNIQIKTISPGGIETDFLTRSIDTATHQAYTAAFDKFMNSDNPLRFSSPETIAGTVYQAVTDDKEQLRYLAGQDALSIYEHRLKVGAENYRKEIIQSLTNHWMEQ